MPKSVTICGFLAVLAGPGTAYALELKENDLTLNLGFDVQLRAESMDAQAPDGGDWDILNGRAGTGSDVNFSMRRARLFLDGSYGDDWKFFLGYLADNVDRQGNGTGRGASIYKAYITRIFKVDDEYTASLQGGMDYAFYNRALVKDPYWLFAQMRPTGNLMGVRSVGGRGMFSGARFDWGIDIMESQDPAKPNANADQHEGLFASSRLEVTAFNSDDRRPAYRESYGGLPGHSLLLAADVGCDYKDYGTAGVETTAICVGSEALLHWDGLSLLGEARILRTDQSPISTGTDTSVRSQIFLVQAGYAFPCFGITIEPDARISLIDLDVGNHHEQVPYNGVAVPGVPNYLIFSASDAVESGTQFDLGSNLYFNKVISLQLSYSHWTAEAGRGNADIWRAQLQLCF